MTLGKVLNHDELSGIKQLPNSKHSKHRLYDRFTDVDTSQYNITQFPRKYLHVLLFFHASTAGN